MRRVDVALGERSYPIFIGDRLLANSGELLARFGRDGRISVVTDERVWECAGAALKEGLEAVGIEPHPILMPCGEEAKTWSGLSGLVDRLLEFGVERSDHIVALGGGAIGDVTGFAASIVKRGCFYLQIPTTLLAQVDSSVGGKTAINSAAGKNLVGAFHQPAAVLIDPSTLDTLPERELRAGYAEVAKYGLIGDAGFFAWCEEHGEAVIAGDSGARLHAIETSVRAKASIVGEDEREMSGRRALLNLGHTFGHAIEAATGLSGSVLHGEAVALGMALAFRFSAERGLCPPEDARRISDHLRRMRLPTSLGEVGLSDGGGLVPHMLHDKKRTQGSLPFILAHGIGKAFVDSSVELPEVEAFLRRQD
ncbi:MAG: 3-dehydroquinate synthase [Pseudomonadota bacterium]|nr:3-dehydroquinate synthase [Pseudomonadota bacterium]